jgi:superfamily I DNA/RNA helicase
MRCNFQAGPIIEALDKAGIPYRVPEELRLENQPEVKQLLKFAEALDPKSKEAGEILRTFLPYVSRTEAVEILMRAENHPAGIYGVVRDPRFSALARSLSEGLTSFLVEAERQFRIVEYWSKVDPESKSTRKENIRVLIDLSRSIKGRGLEGVSELKSKLRGSSKKTGVTISTIHGAKGLEWNHVVVAGCSKGLLPYEAPQTKSDPDEERRCMYVAVTRASDTLTLTCPNMIEKTRPLGPSPYIGEIAGAFT